MIIPMNFKVNRYNTSEGVVVVKVVSVSVHGESNTGIALLLGRSRYIY